MILSDCLSPGAFFVCVSKGIFQLCKVLKDFLKITEARQGLTKSEANNPRFLGSNKIFYFQNFMLEYNYIFQGEDVKFFKFW